MTLRAFPLIAVALLAAACAKGPDKSAATAEAKPLLVSTEDVHTVKNAAIASGPAVIGSVQPERRADLRAEVSAIVMQVVRENGDVVRRGDLLVRLDDTSIRDALASAEAAARLGRSPRTVRRIAQRCGRKIGRTWFIPTDALATED